MCLSIENPVFILMGFFLSASLDDSKPNISFFVVVVVVVAVVANPPYGQPTGVIVIIIDTLRA